MARSFSRGSASVAALFALLAPMALPKAATAMPIGAEIIASAPHAFNWDSSSDDNSGWNWGSSSDDNSGWNWGSWGSSSDDNSGWNWGGWGCSNPVQYTWANICGKVLCGKDADQVSCATVSLIDSTGKVICTTQSDSCGNYSFCEWLPVGSYTVSACKTPDYITASSAPFSVSSWYTCNENVTLTAQAAVFADVGGATGHVFFFPQSKLPVGPVTLQECDLYTTTYQSSVSSPVYYPYSGTVPGFPQYTQCNPFVGYVAIIEPLLTQSQIDANAEAAIDALQAGKSVTGFDNYYNFVDMYDYSTTNYTVLSLFDHPNSGPTTAYCYQLTGAITDVGLPVTFVDDSTYLINLSSGCSSEIECQPFSVPVCDMVQTTLDYVQPLGSVVRLYVNGTYQDICGTPHPFNICPVVTTIAAP